MLVLTACSQANFRSTSRGEGRTVPPDTVHFVSEPPKGQVEVGEVTAKKSSRRGVSRAEVMDLLRKEGAEHGCESLLVQSTTASKQFVDPNDPAVEASGRKMRARCFRAQP